MLRLIPLAGMCWGLFYLRSQQDVNLNWPFIAALLATFAALLVASAVRGTRSAIGNGEFFAHLAADIAVYSLLMYSTGGAANPFITYLLVPITVAAITLPAGLAWATTALCIAAYSTLLFWYLPLPLIAPGHNMAGMHHASALNPHLVGMWMNFVVSALLIGYFINRLATTINAQEKRLSRQKERQLEDNQLLAVATLAASAAHELGTPLNTMKLLSEDWLASAGELTPEVRDDLAILHTQIDRCQQVLKKLAGTARSYTDSARHCIEARVYFEELLTGWQVLRPDVQAHIALNRSSPAVNAHFHPALTASLHNLLNNAADASPDRVDVNVHWNQQQAVLRIRDYGSGIRDDIRGQTPLESDKPHGLGLGLFLSRTILARHGGDIHWQLHPDGGTSVEVTLPLDFADEPDVEP